MSAHNCKQKYFSIRGALVTALVAVFTLSACDDDDVSPEQKALDRNRAKWSDSAIASYVYQFDTVCFCVPEETIVVTVNNSVVADGFYTPSGVALSADRLADMRTIEEFFALIQESIDADVDRLDVAYNATFGYPVSISIDQSFSIADEEVAYTISDFQ